MKKVLGSKLRNLLYEEHDDALRDTLRQRTTERSKGAVDVGAKIVLVAEDKATAILENERS